MDIEKIEDMVEEDERVARLSSTDEDKLKEAHSKDYTGTDDDMPEAYEHWLEGLTIAEIEEIIK